jgi:hypothetical protein
METVVKEKKTSEEQKMVTQKNIIEKNVFIGATLRTLSFKKSIIFD